MGHPVVHSEIHGQDAAVLHGFYKKVLGWSIDSHNPMADGRVDTGPENGLTDGTPAGQRQRGVTFRTRHRPLQRTPAKAGGAGPHAGPRAGAGRAPGPGGAQRRADRAPHELGRLHPAEQRRGHAGDRGAGRARPGRASVGRAALRRPRGRAHAARARLLGRAHAVGDCRPGRSSARDGEDSDAACAGCSRRDPRARRAAVRPMKL